MDWTFVYLMLGLKLPIIALLWLVWYAIRAEPEPEPEATDAPDDGGAKTPRHPRRPFPRRPRRGPHGDPPLPAPARTRTVSAKSKRVA